MALAKKLASMKLKGQLGSTTLAGNAATQKGVMRLNKPERPRVLSLKSVSIKGTGKQVTGGARKSG